MTQLETKKQNPIENGNKQEVNANEQSNTGSNGQDFRSIMGETDNCGLSETKHKELFACKNEKYSSPIIFSNELLLRVHIFESHQCPACNFSTMYDRDLLIHFRTHSDKNQERCDICGIFVKNVKEHRERVHAKCSACKRFLWIYNS